MTNTFKEHHTATQHPFWVRSESSPQVLEVLESKKSLKVKLIFFRCRDSNREQRDEQNFISDLNFASASFFRIKTRRIRSRLSTAALVFVWPPKRPHDQNYSFGFVSCRTVRVFSKSLTAEGPKNLKRKRPDTLQIFLGVKSISFQ